MTENLSKKWLVSYTSHGFRSSLFELYASAEPYFDHLLNYSPALIKKSKFYKRNKATLDSKKGSGFWLWKPYCILDVLEKADEGEFVVYSDARMLFTGDPAPLFDICAARNGILLFAGHYEDQGAPGPSLNRHWVKRDCFVNMAANSPRYHNAQHADASLIVLQKTEAAVDFARAFLKACEVPLSLCDGPSPPKCGLQELPEFIDHRHDQSILSILAEQRLIPLARHPSQWGNHHKQPHLRQPGEELKRPYQTVSWPGSEYPTLLDHHRKTKDHDPLFPDLDLARATEKNRASLAGVPRWITDEDYEAAIYWYGLPEQVRHLIDNDIGDCTTYTDVLVHAAGKLKKPINYLEVGVSVGKNLFQIHNALKDAHLTAMDFEDINPTFRRLLPSKTERLAEWGGPATSLRKAPSWHERYSSADGQANVVEYVCSDIWDERGWERLAQKGPYNLIFSDAAHAPEALEYEWEMIKKNGLLNSDQFLMLWDDLGSDMGDVFQYIAFDMYNIYGVSYSNMHFGNLHGWLGVNEHAHQIGVVTKNMNLSTRQ